MPMLPVSWASWTKLGLYAESLGLPLEAEVDAVLLRLLESNTTSNEGSWVHSGVVLPEGTLLRFTYSDHRFDGVVRDGLLQFDDVREESVSKAAAAAVESRTGRSISINGWTTVFAEVAAPGGKRWQKLADLRRTAQEAR